MLFFETIPHRKKENHWRSLELKVAVLSVLDAVQLWIAREVSSVLIFLFVFESFDSFLSSLEIVQEWKKSSNHQEEVPLRISCFEYWKVHPMNLNHFRNLFQSLKQAGHSFEQRSGLQHAYRMKVVFDCLVFEKKASNLDVEYSGDS